jgi:sugar/nucleoside kinase (ribokinase family)
MSIEQCRKILLDFLGQIQRQKCNAVVLPDFFLDRFINIPWTSQEFISKIQKVTQHKGGSLDGIPQTDLAGGNAINVASALTNLGAQVTPIICTSQYGLEQIRHHFKGRSLNDTHIKTSGDASATTALEFNIEGGKSNVMVRYLGALKDFGPDDLLNGDYKLIEQADFVCLFNWAGTLHHGTELAEAVFKAAKRGKCKTYYDTADPNPKANQIPDLIDRILKTSMVDVLSLNENEAVTYASYLTPCFKQQHQDCSLANIALEAARLLAKHFSARIDLHTTDFSATLKDTYEVIVPAFKVKPLRATGAGDSWCAGNILGSFYNLPDDSRLMFANAVAACYLQSPHGAHPTRRQLESFLQGQCDS